MMTAATSFASPQMDWDAPDPITAFTRFKQKCQLMFSSVLKGTDDEEKVSYILLWSGEKGLDIYNSWAFTKEEDRKKPDVIFERFENQLEPKTSHRIHRYTLQGIRQEQGEPVDDFISRLKNLAAKCQFRDNAEIEDRVLDQLIWGSRNPDVQKSLISRDKSLTLAAAIEIARSHEATSKHMKTLAGSSRNFQEDRSINAIRREQEREFCNNCGKQHPRNKCPAYGTSCRKCGKANHWQSVCRSGKRKQLNQGTKSVFKKVIHAIEDKDDDDDDEILTISSIEVNAIEDTQHSIHDTRDEAFATLEITQPEKKRKINLQCKVDTGAQSNVLPVRLLRIIAPEKFDDEGNPKPEALEKNKAVLSAYGGSIVKQLGTINIPCKYKEKKINCIFYVTDTPGPAILGLKACTALKLISLHCSLKTNQLDQAAPTNSFVTPAQSSGTRKKRPNYIESQVPLNERPPIRNKQELMEMYPECFNGTVGPSKNQEEVRDWHKARQDNQSYYYNRHTRDLPKIHMDHAIFAQDPVRKTWSRARVIDQGNTPRSYIVQTRAGAQLRRNRIHLRPNNASNNLANNLSNYIPQGSMATQSSSANPQEKKQCTTLKRQSTMFHLSRNRGGSKKNLARDVKFRHQKDLTSDSCFSRYY